MAAAYENTLKKSRNDAIVRAWEGGASINSLGKEYGITRQRVQLIIGKERRRAKIGEA